MLKHFFRFPIIIIVVIVAITGVLGYFIKDLVIDNDTTTFLPKDNPSRVIYHEIEDTYGAGMIMALTLKVKEGYIYSRKNLEIIDRIVADIEEIPDIEDINSLINIDYLVGIDGGIEVTPLIEDLPETEEEELEIKRKLESWELYKGNFYSEDFKSTMISIKIILGAKNETAENVYKEVKTIIKNYKDTGFEFHVAGMPSILVVMAKFLREDLIRLIPLVIIILLLTLFLSFRTLGGVILPTITVLISTVCSIGIMSVFKIPFTMVSVGIPILMIAVGSAYGIHILSHYYDEIDLELKEKGSISEDKSREILFLTLKRIGGAVMLAALTTMAGFGSLATSKIVPLKQFGIFTAIGVGIAFIVSCTFIPSIILLRHKVLKHKLKNNKKNEVNLLTTVLMAVNHFFIKSKIRTIILATIVLAIAVFGTSRIIVGNPMVNYFRKNTEIRKSDEFANKNFSGTTLIDVVIDGEESGSLTNPDILVAMDNLSNHLKEKFPRIGNTISFSALIKKMNEVINSDEEGDYYEIPYDPAKYNLSDKNELKQLITQYLLLFSGNISEYVDDSLEPSQTKLTLMLKSENFNLLREIKKEIIDYTNKNFPEGYKITITGNAELQNVVSNLIVESQILNILTSLVAVFLILTIYFKSPLAGIFGIVSLAIPILLNFGIMGIFKIRLDAGTALIASVAIGIGIDYTIHFINAYHHERKINNDLEEVTKKTLLTSGKAIVFNATAVAFGFAVLIFSNFLPLVNFGILVALTMFTASFSAMTLLPVMLNIVKPKFITK